MQRMKDLGRTIASLRAQEEILSAFVSTLTHVSLTSTFIRQ